MGSNKQYFKLLKEIPFEKCPDDFTARVVNHSGILDKKEAGYNTGTQRNGSSFYSIACIFTAFLILLVINYNVGNLNKYSTDMLSTNTIAFANQLSKSFIITFVSPERNDVK